MEVALRTGSHGRTDQFAVANQLEGLQEKFQVLNRDELADALRSRLSELEDYRKSWTPEILSLILQLSDRPALLSKVDRIPTLAKPHDQTVSLSWSDLNAHGAAYSDEDIWEEVDFAADSSDDDFSSISSDGLSPKVVSQTSDDPEEEYVVPSENFVPGTDDNLISSIEHNQFWRIENHPAVPRSKEDASCTITELQLARETIFMLQGLPTSIFWRLDDDIEVDRRYALAHSSNEALSSLLRSFSGIGAKVDAVRRFTKMPQTIPYMQTFCRGIEEWLLEFDGFLSQTQRQCLSPGSTVSLLHLLDDVRQRSGHLILLADIVASLGQEMVDQPVCCLTLLYDLVCMLEALGDDDAFRGLTELFLSCFKTYLRPVQLWMENGQLDSADTTFFVRVNSGHHGLRTLWHDWYSVDESIQRQNIPRFLETSIRKVFTTGKTMVFLQHLNALPDRSEPPEQSAAVFDTVLPSDSPSSLSIPFSALLEAAFDRMVDANHSSSSDLLGAELGQKCGLWNSLDALQHVYLGKNLSVFSMIDAKVFDLMDRGRSWDDKFLLTELARTAFNAVDVVDPSRLVVRASGSSDQARSRERSVKIIEAISIDYILPWPIANIITDDAIQSYRRIAAFLMQIRRAKYVIVKQRLRDARHTAHGKDETLAHALHHNLLWFLDSLYGYITYLVISTTTQSLHATLSSAEDVDGMITAHKLYMSSLENQCLLSENLSPLHEAIMNILDLCIHFADLQTAQFSDNLELLPNASDVSNTRGKWDPEDNSLSDEDENENSFAHEHTLTASFCDSPYEHQMRSIKRQFEHLVNFTADGLKGVARADGLPSWDILADRLAWRRDWLRF